MDIEEKVLFLRRGRLKYLRVKHHVKNLLPNDLAKKNIHRVIKQMSQNINNWLIPKSMWVFAAVSFKFFIGLSFLK